MSGSHAILEPLARTLAHQAGVRVEIKGQEAYTDGKTIVLPALPITLTEPQWRAANGYLDHEAGHVLHTDFTALPPDPLLAQILNVLEDARIEDRYCRRYPGAAENLTHAFRQAMDELGPQLPNLEPYQRHLLALAIRLLRRGDPPTGFDPDSLAWADRWAASRAQVLAAKTTRALLPLAEEIRRDLVGPSQGTQKAPEGSQDSQQPPGGPAGVPTAPRGTSGQPDGQQEGPAGPAGPLPGEKGDDQAVGLPADKERPLPGGGDTGQGQAPPPQGEVTPESLLSQTMRGQVNAAGQQKGYRPPQLTRARPLPECDSGPLDRRMYRLVPGLARRIERAVTATTQARWVPDQERGRIDPRRLARLALGTSNRVFRRLEQGKKLDTAVSLIVDASGSMRRERETAVTSIAVVARSMDRLGVATEVLAFSGLNLQLAKGYDESIRLLTRRLSCLQTGGGTPLGSVMLAAAKRLVQRHEQRKLLVVSTDGQPDNKDHTREVINRCQRVGIEVLGLGIHCDISPVFARAVTIPTIDQLAPVLLGRLRGLLLHGA